MAQEIKKSDSPTPVSRLRDPFSEMRNEIERVFDSFTGRGFGRLPSLFEGKEGPLSPTMDIKENDRQLTVEAELPGMEEKDIDVSLRDGVLTIKGEKKSEREEKEEDYHVSERTYGSFQRAFRLPDTVDEDNISADMDKGVLKIVIPKKPGTPEKRIPVSRKAGEQM